MSQLDLSIIEVGEYLNELGLNNISLDGNEYKFSCPFSGHRNGDANPSASMEQGTTRFHCFSCGASGNSVSFLADLEGISRKKARQFIRERFGDGFMEPVSTFSDEIEAQLGAGEREIEGLRRSVILDEEEQRRRFLGFENHTDAYYYLMDRGFSRRSMNELEFGYDIISDRPCFPIRDIDGNLIGFKARAYKEDQSPRYLILGGPEYGFEHYEASRAIWGIHALSKHIEGRLIICEGELNAMMLRQNGFPNACGISGKTLSAWQATKIMELANEVTLIFDEQIDALRAAERLSGINVKIIPQRDRDPMELSEEETKSLLSRAKSPLELALNKL